MTPNRFTPRNNAIKKAFGIVLPCALGLSQSLWCATNSPAPQRTKLQVRWEAPTNALPATVWVYRVEPKVFSAGVISNVMTLAGYTTNEETVYGTNGMVFSSPKRVGNLRISFPEASIKYWTEIPFGLTHLATAVPEEKQLYELTTNFISRVGIGLDELVNKTNSAQPLIHYLEDQVMFTSTNSVITNIWSREARFHRLLDGVEFIGFDRGGDGVIEFGDHATILRFSLSWWNVKRQKAYPTVTPVTTMRWIREGKAHPDHIPGSDAPRLQDWTGVKTVTVKHARLVCVGAGRLDEPGFSTLRPFVAMEGAADIGTTNFDVGIDCPAFEDQTDSGGGK